MKIVRAEVRNVGFIRERALDFRESGMTVVYGASGCGKSMMVSAIKAGLIMPSGMGYPLRDQLQAGCAENPWVALSLEGDDGTRVRLEKTFCGEWKNAEKNENPDTILTESQKEPLLGQEAIRRFESITGISTLRWIMIQNNFSRLARSVIVRDYPKQLKDILIPQERDDVSLVRGMFEEIQRFSFRRGNSGEMEKIDPDDMDDVVTARFGGYVNPYLHVGLGNATKIRVEGWPHPQEDQWEQVRLWLEDASLGQSRLFEDATPEERAIVFFAILLGMRDLRNKHEKSMKLYLVDGAFEGLSLDHVQGMYRMMQQRVAKGDQVILFTKNPLVKEVVKAEELVVMGGESLEAGK